jgi:hypothetical protein
MINLSVQPAWCRQLPLQQQSVLLLAARGPDGVGKSHPCKAIQRAYRGTVLVAAKYGRELRWGERADSFMSLHEFSDDEMWPRSVEEFFGVHDALPHHYLMHLYHGAQILGSHHPDHRFRVRWATFYLRAVDEMHVPPEAVAVMDERLGDWGRRFWE